MNIIHEFESGSLTAFGVPHPFGIHAHAQMQSEQAGRSAGMSYCVNRYHGVWAATLMTLSLLSILALCTKLSLIDAPQGPRI